MSSKLNYFSAVTLTLSHCPCSSVDTRNMSASSWFSARIVCGSEAITSIISIISGSLFSSQQAQTSCSAATSDVIIRSDILKISSRYLISWNWLRTRLKLLVVWCWCWTYFSRCRKCFPDNFNSLQHRRDANFLRKPGRVFNIHLVNRMQTNETFVHHKPSLSLFTLRNFWAILMIYDGDILLATFCWVGKNIFIFFSPPICFSCAVFEREGHWENLSI